MKFYTPLEYIKIDVASQFGLDREAFEARIQWADENHTHLEKLREKADDPERFIAAVMALRQVEAGQPTSHLCGLDACASGPQIMSAFMRDPVGAENTSMIGNQRADIYTKTTETMNQLLGAASTYDRQTIKYALMPFYDGSKARPKTAFGNGTPERNAFYEARAIVAPGAAQLMDMMRNSWQPHALEHCWTLPDGFEIKLKVTAVKDSKIKGEQLEHASFTDQHTVNKGTEDGLVMAANIVQSTNGFIIRELGRRCSYNAGELGRVRKLLKKRAAQRHLNGVELDSIQELWVKHKFLSLVDADELEWEEVKRFDFTYCDQLTALIDRCLERPSFPVITVHDAFKAHANYMNWVRLTYAELLAEISESNIIDTILEDVTGRPANLKKLSSGIGDQIRQSEYALS